MRLLLEHAFKLLKIEIVLLWFVLMLVIAAVRIFILLLSTATVLGIRLDHVAAIS